MCEMCITAYVVYSTQHSFCYSFALVFISLLLSFIRSDFDFIDCTYVTNTQTHEYSQYTYMCLLLLLLLSARRIQLAHTKFTSLSSSPNLLLAIPLYSVECLESYSLALSPLPLEVYEESVCYNFCPRLSVCSTISVSPLMLCSCFTTRSSLAAMLLPIWLLALSV